MTCEDAPCCGCCDLNESVDYRMGENCCPDCGDPSCFGDCLIDSESWSEDDMDGDFDSGMASAGYGTDEDYGFYGNYEDDYGDDY